MARILEKQIRIEGMLEVSHGIHIGNSNEELSLDMSVARAGDGNVYLPGTSLAGPMRSWWQRSFPDTFAVVWGDVGSGNRTDAQPQASLIRIHDAQAVGDTLKLDVRDGVGIDRYSGTAADKVKFDREIVSPGARFEFEALLELPEAELFNQLAKAVTKTGSKEDKDDDEQATRLPESTDIEKQFAALIKAIAGGEIRFGGAKTRGLGKLCLVEGKKAEVSYTSAQSLLSILTKGEGTGTEAYEKFIESAESPARANVVDIEIQWHSDGPVMTKSPVQSTLVDMLPMTVEVGKNAKLVLPGSGTKGAIRSFAERILRTLSDHHTVEDDFNNQLDHESLDLAHLILGKKLGNNAKNGRMGALFIEDCYPEVPEVAAEKLAELEGGQSDTTPSDHPNEPDKAKSPTVQKILKNSGWEAYYNSQHNAIDRWTGGVSDGALYNMLLPPKAKMSKIYMRLDLDRIDDGQRHACLAFLLIMLREMQAGRIPLGFGANRGLGTLKIDEILLEGAGDFTAFSGGISELLGNKQLADAWSSYVTKPQEQEAA